MVKKYGTILMLFTALVIMLGHNFIPHHHHDFKLSLAEHHHHHSGDHLHGDDSEENNESEESDLGDLFSNFQHGVNGITFLISHHLNNTIEKQLPPSSAFLTEVIVYQNFVEFARQNSPPYKDVDQNSLCLLPYGMRAPPVSIV